MTLQYVTPWRLRRTLNGLSYFVERERNGYWVVEFDCPSLVSAKGVLQARVNGNDAAHSGIWNWVKDMLPGAVATERARPARIQSMTHAVRFLQRHMADTTDSIGVVFVPLLHEGEEQPVSIRSYVYLLDSRGKVASPFFPDDYVLLARWLAVVSTKRQPLGVPRYALTGRGDKLHRSLYDKGVSMTFCGRRVVGWAGEGDATAVSVCRRCATAEEVFQHD